MRSALPGIKSIGYMPCKNLPPFILQKYLVGIPVGIYAVATPVEFFTNASCEADQDPDNGSVLEKTTLHFSTTATIPSNEPLAFVVKDVNDRAYVIGFREAPYPIMTVNEAIDAEIFNPVCYLMDHITASNKPAE